jgi:hypothetical protein
MWRSLVNPPISDVQRTGTYIYIHISVMKNLSQNLNMKFLFVFHRLSTRVDSNLAAEIVYFCSRQDGQSYNFITQSAVFLNLNFLYNDHILYGMYCAHLLQ